MSGPDGSGGLLADGGADPRPRAEELPEQSEVLRQAMTRLSGGVAVVTASWQGRLHAMTATAVCSVSLEPPLILVCVGRASRFHAAILGSCRWAVSLLAEDQVDVARHFSDRGRDLLTQFDQVPHVRGEATDAPLVEGALAWLECTTWATHDGGDHSIVIGQVVAGTAGPGRAADLLPRALLLISRRTPHPQETLTPAIGCAPEGVWSQRFLRVERAGWGWVVTARSHGTVGAR